MTRFHIPAPGLAPWQAALADPIKHWKDGRSAKELARSWVAAERTPRGLPPKVAAVLDTDPNLAGAALLLGVPEHTVELPGRGRPSQNDLWAILRAPSGLVSMTVEGKSGEPFDRPLSEWLDGSSPGKRERLQGLLDLLEPPGAPRLHLMYQLFHRTASAIIEARRFGFSHAIMLVHSFGGVADMESRSHFTEFAAWLGMSQTRVLGRSLAGGMRLSLLWVDDSRAAE